MKASPSASEFREQLVARGHLSSISAEFQALTGGVSSEIYLVKDGDDRQIVVKRALEKLKVEQDWFADRKRNLYEQAFFEVVSSFASPNVPAILFQDSELLAFGMEYLEGFSCWKDELILGECDQHLGRLAGEFLAVMHEETFGDENLERRFGGYSRFRELRVTPYLEALLPTYTEFNELIQSEVSRLSTCSECLIHGDYSPKNILHNGERLVALDAEVAYYGDPAFDLAFLLNHLFLKSLHSPSHLTSFSALIDATLKAYGEHSVRFDLLGSRMTILLPLLMLARIDGKSPVEYLNTDSQKRFVRDFAAETLRAADSSLQSIQSLWFEKLATLSYDNTKH